MIAYKLFRQRKDGSIGPLFINRRQRITMDEWMQAEAHRTKGYAFRPGWHACLQPVAPHLSKRDRVWAKCEIEDYEFYKRPESQGGIWVLAQRLMVVGLFQTPESQAPIALPS